MTVHFHTAGKRREPNQILLSSSADTQLFKLNIGNTPQHRADAFPDDSRRRLIATATMASLSVAENRTRVGLVAGVAVVVLSFMVHVISKRMESVLFLVVGMAHTKRGVCEYMRVCVARAV